MYSGDICGLALIVLVVLCALYGLDRISRPSTLTQEEYEKRLQSGSGIAGSLIGAGAHELEKMLHPRATEAVEQHHEVREADDEAAPESDQEKGIVGIRQ